MNRVFFFFGKSWGREVTAQREMDRRYMISTILSHLTQECHMKYSFAELGIISNIHTSVEDESKMKVDDYSMTG